MDILTAENISRVFREDEGKAIKAVENISLSVKEGEIFMLLGPSGCGKSTLLRILAGLDVPNSGEVKFANFTAKDTNFVFQQFALLPWLTVSQNIELGLIGRRIRDSERKKIVEQELLIFRLGDFADTYPRELSGGMKQRVGLARAFATSPKVIFMDEPFSELDSFTAEDLRRELLSIWGKRKTTIVMVTHNVSEVIELADTIAVMTPRPGKIEQIVKNTLPRPRKVRTNEFFDLEDMLLKLIRP